MELTDRDISHARRWANAYAKRHNLDRDTVTGYALEAIVVLAARHDPARSPWLPFMRSRLRYTTVDLLRRYEGFSRPGLPVPGKSWQRWHANLDGQVDRSYEGPYPLRLSDVIPDPDAGVPFERVETLAEVPRVLDALGQLEPRERAIVLDTYRDGQTLVEAGARHGLGESMTSRVRSAALDRVRLVLALRVRPKACRGCGGRVIQPRGYWQPSIRWCFTCAVGLLYQQ